MLARSARFHPEQRVALHAQQQERIVFCFAIARLSFLHGTYKGPLEALRDCVPQARLCRLSSFLDADLGHTYLSAQDPGLPSCRAKAQRAAFSLIVALSASSSLGWGRSQREELLAITISRPKV